MLYTAPDRAGMSACGLCPHPYVGPATCRTSSDAPISYDSDGAAHVHHAAPCCSLQLNQVSSNQARNAESICITCAAWTPSS